MCVLIVKCLLCASLVAVPLHTIYLIKKKSFQLPLKYLNNYPLFTLRIRDMCYVTCQYVRGRAGICPGTLAPGLRVEEGEVYSAAWLPKGNLSHVHRRSSSLLS